MKNLLTTFLLITLTTLSLSHNVYANNDDFLPADKAFVLTTTEDSNFYDFSWKIEKDYYLYEDKIKIQNDNKELSLSLPSFVMKDDPTFGVVGVYYNDLNIKVNKQEVSGDTFTIHWQGCSDKGLCYNPQSLTINVNNFTSSDDIQNFSTASNSVNSFKGLLANTSQSNFSSGKYDEIVSKQKSINSHENIKIEKVLEAEVVIQKEEIKENNESSSFSFTNLDSTNNLYLIFLIAFIIGITLSFTPCVLPMIPIMSTIIVGDKQNKKLPLIIAFLIPMVIIYSLIGLTVSLVGASVQAFLQSTIVISLISILFVLLSFSMFGFYQIQLPSQITNKLNNIKTKNNSIFSAMILGSISAIISSPCVTAPLASVFLYIAQLGNPLLGFFVLLTLSIGMSIPLILFGLFGEKALPKAGNWLNIIKNGLGYAMLLLSVYMISKISDSIANILLFIILTSISIALYQLSKSYKGIKEHIILLLSILIFSGNLAHVYTNITYNSLPLNKGQYLENQYDTIYTIEDIQNKLSANTSKRSIFYFTATWCATCQVIDKNVLTNETKDILNKNNVELIKLDVSNPNSEIIELMKKINVFGPPTLVEFDKNLNVLKKHNGEFTQNNLLQF